MNWFSNRVRSDEGILTLNGAHDAFSAKMLSRTAAEAVYCGGFAATAAQFALPDIGLLTQTEMVQIYGRMQQACAGKPFIVDADAGHGGLLNVERTVGLLAAAGVAAFHIEDQVLPKRCGHLAGKDVVSRHDAIARVRVAARCSEAHGIGVIARTDAIAVHGFDEAIWRANAYLDAGAAAVFIDAPETPAQIRAIPKSIAGPVVFNAAPTGIAAPPEDRALQEMGYAAVLHPLATIMAATEAITGKFPASGPRNRDVPNGSFAHLNEILETTKYLDREERWSRPMPADHP